MDVVVFEFKAFLNVIDTQTEWTKTGLLNTRDSKTKLQRSNEFYYTFTDFLERYKLPRSSMKKYLRAIAIH